MKYVNVVIDNNTDHTDTLYTYGTDIEDIKVGDKVKVPFALGNRVKDAYVFEVFDQLKDKIRNLKMVKEKDPDISLTEEAVSTCIWMKGRYFCRYIDAVNCFTPAGSSSKRGKKRNPYQDAVREEVPQKEPTEEQKKALDQILPAIERGKHDIFLIHGVTSSGKTEVYMKAIEACLQAGKTAVMLVPEISLTAQTIQRFINYFGPETIAVLHSKLSLGQRYDEWMRVKNGEVKIVIGARSAVFAPLTNIGIIVLDEEHESTYKSDMTPKYDTAEVAIKRTMAGGGILLLGSATPSISSYYRSESGYFKRIEMTKRYNKAPLPAVRIADMREELKNGNRSVFSLELYEEMQQCLARKQQVILFLNRRGYSTFISCRSCGHVMQCPECGISLTYHKGSRALVCHFCGRKEAAPLKCPECESKYIKYFGTGTEKIEEAVGELFPGAVADRLDLDTVKKKGSIEKILKAFQKGKTDILIGTQLVAKGLDFANVGLVGIISADVTLNIPDYRSPERTFQLITQAAGRAGRGDEPGKVIIQSYTPDHYAIVAASGHDYHSFYRQELYLRKQTTYPPFSDFFQVLVSSESEELASDTAVRAAAFLKGFEIGNSGFVMGPQPAPLSRVNGLHRYQVLIKAVSGNRRMFAGMITEMKREIFVNTKSECRLSIDVNPYSFV